MDAACLALRQCAGQRRLGRGVPEPVGGDACRDLCSICCLVAGCVPEADRQLMEARGLVASSLIVRLLVNGDLVLLKNPEEEGGRKIQKKKEEPT